MRALMTLPAELAMQHDVAPALQPVANGGLAFSSSNCLKLASNAGGSAIPDAQHDRSACF
jgi:hypothetical protein